jgi:hypothetical protein
MWMVKLKSVVTAVAALALLTAGLAVVGAQGPAPKPTKGPGTAPPPKGEAPPGVPPNRALAREQLDLIDRALSDLNRLAKGGELSLSNPSFALWRRRKLDALRESGAGKAEIVAELEKYAAFMKDQERYASQAYRTDTMSRPDLTDVQYRRIEAEIWLNQERSR